MDKEVELLSSLMGDTTVALPTNLRLISGMVGKNYVYIKKCGIGKVNAAIQTYKLIENINPDLIINSGVAGGASGLPVGTVVIADRVAYHDVWCGPGTEYGQADGRSKYYIPLDVMTRERNYGDANVINGLVCTGDKFISSKDEIDYIKSNYPDVVAVDMESAAIAQVCEMKRIPFGIVRILSDTPGVVDDNYSQYQDFWKNAPKVLFDVVKTIVEDV